MLDHIALREAAATGTQDDIVCMDIVLSSLTLSNDSVVVKDEVELANAIGVVAKIAAFGSAELGQKAHQAAWEIAKSLGIFPASIDELYRKIASVEVGGFTVPAINMRAIAFQSARGVFRAMKHKNVGAVIFELSRGEVGFTGQRPHEYATCILCAAIAESHAGPVFLQGDHFQISATRYAENPAVEVAAVESLIAEAVSAGFYNIDVDTSTLVDLSHDSVDAQQYPNYSLSAHLAMVTRSVEPKGVTISIGGEIGEVGDKNSTAEEVRAYLDGFAVLMTEGMPGMTKMSIQSGTRHGGNVLVDGTFGDMPIDFALIRELSQACRYPYGLAGCVQHGASMLSIKKISELPGSDCIEVHLAAAFLNAVYDNLPGDLVKQADDWVKQSAIDEWEADWSEAQFLHHARRYPIGPFKKTWWDAIDCHAAVREAVYQRALEYFQALGVIDTKQLISDATTHLPVDWKPFVLDTDVQALDEKSIKDLAS